MMAPAMIVSRVDFAAWRRARLAVATTIIARFTVMTAIVAALNLAAGIRAGIAAAGTTINAARTTADTN